MIWKNARSLTLAAAMILTPAAGLPGDAPEPPDGVKDVDAGSVSLTLWPYTSTDFESPSDPINLLFPNADPRAIRQELLKLDGSRPPFAAVPGSSCRWTDAMGYEHAAFAQPEGWVGSAVQLACVMTGAPLGSPFRFHVRLFRQGDHTIGNATNGMCAKN